MIGIITSSIDTLYLFQFLNRYNFSYVVWYDQEGGNRGEKPSSYVLPRVTKAIEELKKQGVTHVIVPPTIECLLLADKQFTDSIIPLFTTYVKQACLPFSRVGKIGFCGDRLDIQSKDSIEKLCHTHTLTETQAKTKSFQNPLAYWFKETPMRKYFLTSLGWKNRMMHNVVKQDMHYFLDAGVDTVIPLNYGYFAYDATVIKLLATKKTRRHRIETLQKIFDSLVVNVAHSDYKVTVFYTGTNAHLLNEKKRMWLLEKGKEAPVSFHLVAA